MHELHQHLGTWHSVTRDLRGLQISPRAHEEPPGRNKASCRALRCPALIRNRKRSVFPPPCHTEENKSDGFVLVLLLRPTEDTRLMPMSSSNSRSSLWESNNQQGSNRS